MKNTKVLRGQLRQIAQELLPELMKEALFEEITKQMIARVNAIEEFTKKTMTEMNERHKDTMGMLVRSVVVGDKDEK